MLTCLQKIMNASNLENFCDANNPFLKNLPFHFFWKNKKGAYQGCSDGLANDLGFASGAALLGVTDYDLCWASSASKFRYNDEQVMLGGHPKVMIESGVLHNGKEGRAISYKIPLRSQHNKIIGVICAAIEFNQCDLFPLLISDELKTGDFSSIFVTDAITSYDLTKRQAECLYYLVRGMTIKQIANKLSLSPRTVEHYLEAVKAKLGCHTRSQLIDKLVG